MQMSSSEMENLLALSTDIGRNKDDPYGDGDQSEHHAESSEGKILRGVWASGADYSETFNAGISIIHRLCVQGDVKNLKRLLERSDEFELPRLLEKRISALRVTPLMATVTARRMLPDEALRHVTRRDHVEVAKLLLKAGARTEAKDVAGHTAFHKAAGEFVTPASLEIAKEILKAGGDMNARNRFGETTLFRVTCVDPRDGVDQLLGDGLNRDIDRETLPDMAVWLVASGADMDLGATGAIRTPANTFKFFTPRECPTHWLQRVLIFTEAQREIMLATGARKKELDLQRTIFLGGGRQRFERQDGPKQRTVVEEEQPQEKLEMMLPSIERFVLESKSWKIR